MRKKAKIEMPASIINVAGLLPKLLRENAPITEKSGKVVGKTKKTLSSKLNFGILILM